MNKYDILEKKANKNYKDIKKLRRLIYLLMNDIDVYKGKKGGYYYYTSKSKIYL